MKKLIEYANSSNIADSLDDQTLVKLANRVCEQFEEDYQSMEDWRELIDKGIELSRPSLTPRSEPWQGAANYKYNGMLAAAISFGDRASTEILRSKDLFMMDVVGEDPDEAKKQKAERISIYENAHINYKMDEWRENQESVCYSVPAYGTMFKKVFFDPMEGKKVSSLIHYPNFAISQGTTSLETCRSFTEIHSFSLNEAYEKMHFGEWRECNVEVDVKNQQEGSNASSGVDSAEENPCRYFEQHTYFDLDDDGYEEPYIVTVHEATQQVVRVVAAYTEKDIIVKMGKEIYPLEQAKELGEDGYAEVCKRATMVKINRDMNIVKYGFIRSPDGTFLDIGYYYLLSAITNLINTTYNQLIDAGTLSNRQGGFLSKEFRKKGGMTAMKPGEFRQTDIPAVNLQNGIMPLPVKEPSNVLYQLNLDAKAELQQFANTVDMSDLMTGNTPATTALVAIQEQITPTSAIMNRMLRAQSREFAMLYRLTPEYCKDMDYKDITGDDSATIKNDYDDETNLKATAQKKMSNDVLRMFDAQAQLEHVNLVLSAGGNPIPIIKNYYEQLEFADTEEIFPEMTPEQEQQQAELMRIEQQKQAQLLDLQIAKEMKAVEAFAQEQQAFLADEQRKTAQLQEEIAKLRSEILLNQAKVAGEKASAAKDMADAEAQKIENEMIKSGAMEVVEKALTIEVPGDGQEG